MKFDIIFNITIFYLAIEKENIEIIRLFLTSDKFDINIPYIYRKLFIFKI